MHRDPKDVQSAQLQPRSGDSEESAAESPDELSTESAGEFPRPNAVAENRFTAADVAAIVERRGWISAGTRDASDAAGFETWFARATTLLGPMSPTSAHLESLLELVFHYNAAESLAVPDHRVILVRTGAREVIRELANRILDVGGIVDSDRFKEVVDGIKAAVPFRSRVIFHPLRLTLAGRVGEGELDRVILLLDPASKLPFAVRVKDTRERMLEFCAALD